MESLTRTFKLLKRSFGMERVERPENQNIHDNGPHTAIRRVASRLHISEDRATVLLLHYHWDESQINSPSLLSDYCVTNPEFDRAVINCRICNRHGGCQNLGCGHFSCADCFDEHVMAKILVGELDLFCPFVFCGKYLSHARINSILSADGRAIYEQSLFENWRRAFSEDSLIKTVGSLIVRRGTELGNALGLTKKELIFLGLLVVLFQSKSYLDRMTL